MEIAPSSVVRGSCPVRSPCEVTILADEAAPMLAADSRHRESSPSVARDRRRDPGPPRPSVRHEDADHRATAKLYAMVGVHLSMFKLIVKNSLVATPLGRNHQDRGGRRQAPPTRRAVRDGDPASPKLVDLGRIAGAILSTDVAATCISSGQAQLGAFRKA